MPNKTVNVKFFLDYANTQLARTDEYATKEFKSGICVMISQILMRSNQYNGYSHNNPEDCDRETLGDYTRTYWMIKE